MLERVAVLYNPLRSFTGLTDGRVPLASGSPVATKRWCNEFPGLIYSAGQAVTIAVSNVHRAMTGRLWKKRAYDKIRPPTHHCPDVSLHPTGSLKPLPDLCQP
jgi:hypothetical protein